MAAPGYAELERAIASVPGVAEAGVGLSPETGRGRLRIRLAPGEDPEAVSWAVAATLRERFGIALDPDDIRSRTADEGAEAAQTDAVRLVEDDSESAEESQELSVARERLSEAAQAALSRLHGTIGREEPAPQATADPDADPFFAASEPSAEPTDAEPAQPSDAEPFEPADTEPPSEPAPATEPETPVRDEPVQPEVEDLRAVASVRSRRRAAIRDLVTRHAPDAVEVVATLRLGDRDAEGHARGVPTRAGVLRAVAEATVDAVRELSAERVLASIDDVVASTSGEPAVARVVVSVLGDDGEESLVGAALVRGDLERAVMRATLDALNRRLEPVLLTAAG